MRITTLGSYGGDSLGPRGSEAEPVTVAEAVTPSSSEYLTPSSSSCPRSLIGGMGGSGGYSVTLTDGTCTLIASNASIEVALKAMELFECICEDSCDVDGRLIVEPLCLD
jgi:hypothetical protein